MKCKLCDDKLMEYLYGELGDEDAAAMEKHLEASDACRRIYEGFASVLETVGETDEDEPAAALHTRIMGHAEEAGPERGSFWAWMFRPAMTTAVIGAVAAGVYFTSLRYKPPSLLDERVFSEESLIRETKPRSTPPSSRAKVDELKKEAKKKGFLTGLAEPPAPIEQEEPVPKPQEIPEKKSQVAGTIREAPSPSYKVKAVPMRLSAPTGRELESARAPVSEEISQANDLADEDTPVPDAIANARDLASEGKCVEAGKRVDAYATDHPTDKASGIGWLEVAHCYAKKGDTETAREMAEKALHIPAYESEARAFLDSLSPPGE